MSVWTNDQLHDMVTVAISLSAGVNIDQECKVSISANNNDLIVKEKMVDMLSNVDTMHSYWRKKDPNALPPSHAKIMGFHQYFSSLREREDDDIYCTAVIPLPFPVQKAIVNMHKMGNNAGARILYVELRAVEYNDYKVPAGSELMMIN